MRILCSLALVILIGTAHAADREFLSGYVGSLPTAKEDLAKTYFYRPEVQRLLAALERGPISETTAAQILGAATPLRDLERLHLVRRDDGMVKLAFAYFTAEDVKAIHAAAEEYVPKLVAAYAEKRATIDRALTRYPVASVSRKRLAFVLIAGFSLNWDGLTLTRERHYREPLLIRGKGWSYSFWASEEVPAISYRGYYWGSSTFPAGAINLNPPLDFAYSSFGDAESDPRMNFPDLLGLPGEAMTPPVRAAAAPLLHDDNSLGMGLKNAIGIDRAGRFGKLLFALRGNAQTLKELCGADATCAGELGLLVAAGYAVKQEDGRYQLLVPVFDHQDKAMVGDVLQTSREAIAAWLTQNYGPMKSDLSGLTAARQGVPYPALFTQIWHEMFGLATCELAAKGLIEDPRAPGAPWNGSIPAVWRSSVYHWELG